MLVIWASYQSRDLRQINTTGKSPAAGEMLSSHFLSFRGASKMRASPESIAPQNGRRAIFVFQGCLARACCACARNL
jgi:hypothetical protein